jgi:O-antigen/teichoic acid export membrane protein
MPKSPSIRVSTVSGTAWTAALSAANKAITAGATYVIARQLAPDQYGMAGVATSVACALVVITPQSASDVVSSRVGVGMTGRDASRVAWPLGIAMSVLFLAATLPAARLYGKYPAADFVPLLVALALRPVLEAWTVGPLTDLRLQMRFRSLALSDGATQAAATLLTVVMAVAGFGAMSLIAPQVAAVAVRAVAYRAMLERPSPDTGMPRSLLGPSVLLGLGQYAHNFLFVMDVLVLGAVASEEQSGYFTFAFMLSSQANAVISFQIGAVLQTALGKLASDPVRQAAAYLRALRSMAIVAIAICSLQAALGELLFSVVFDIRWRPAALVFAWLSIAQAFFFAAAPTMALLKAQGRFRLYLAWQVIQAVVSVPVFALLAARGGAIYVATGTAVLWAASLTIVACVACRAGGVPAWKTLEALYRPWVAALVVAVPVHFAAANLPHMPFAPGLATVVALALAGVVAALTLNRLTYPAAWIDFQGVVQQLAARGKGKMGA